MQGLAGKHALGHVHPSNPRLRSGTCFEQDKRYFLFWLSEDKEGKKEASGFTRLSAHLAVGQTLGWSFSSFALARITFPLSLYDVCLTLK